MTKVPFYDHYGKIYTQTDGVDMSSPLGTTIKFLHDSCIYNSFSVGLDKAEPTYTHTQSHTHAHTLALTYMYIRDTCLDTQPCQSHLVCLRFFIVVFKYPIWREQN